MLAGPFKKPTSHWRNAVHSNVVLWKQTEIQEYLSHSGANQLRLRTISSISSHLLTTQPLCSCFNLLTFPWKRKNQRFFNLLKFMFFFEEDHLCFEEELLNSFCFFDPNLSSLTAAPLYFTPAHSFVVIGNKVPEFKKCD